MVLLEPPALVVELEVTLVKSLRFFCRMAGGYGGTTRIGRIGSTVRSEATLLILLILTNPTLPRQVGSKIQIEIEIFI